MEMETKDTIEAISRNIQKNLKIVEPNLKMGLKEAYDAESTFRLSLSIGIKPTSQIDREIKGRISFPVLKVSKAFSDAVAEGQMELEFEDAEADLPVEEAVEVECPGCREVIDRDDAVQVLAFEKPLCPDCAAFWVGDIPEDEDPQEDVVEETAPEAGEKELEEISEIITEPAGYVDSLADTGKWPQIPLKTETAPHADWPIPLDPDEIKRLQPVEVAELVALVKEKFPLAHYHAKEILKVTAIRGAAICREALHHMNGWYRNSGPGKTETEAEDEHGHENTMGG